MVSTIERFHCITVYAKSDSFCLPIRVLLLLLFVFVSVAEAAATEQHSLHSVHLLVVMCCECVALWRVLCEGNMNLTAEKLGAVSGRGERGVGKGERGVGEEERGVGEEKKEVGEGERGVRKERREWERREWKGSGHSREGERKVRRDGEKCGKGRVDELW